MNTLDLDIDILALDTKVMEAKELLKTIQVKFPGSSASLVIPNIPEKTLKDWSEREDKMIHEPTSITPFNDIYLDEEHGSISIQGPVKEVRYG